MAHRKKKKTNRSTAEELMRMYDRWTPGVGRQSLMQSDPTWSAATAINTPFKRSIMTSSPWDMIRKELIDRGSQRVADSVGPWLGQGTTPMRNPVSTVTTKRQAGPPRHQLTAALQRRDPREQVRQDLTRDKVGDRVYLYTIGESHLLHQKPLLEHLISQLITVREISRGVWLIWNQGV